MLKTLFFIFLFYMLVKVVSRYFLNPKRNGNFKFFYQTFKNVRQQQKQQQERQKKSPSQNGKVKKNDLDNIEEAEFEDVTEESSKNSSNS